MTRKPLSERAERGFTLIELLVAITLLGILTTALMGGLSLGTRVWETSQKTLDDNSQAQMINRFLKNRLEGTLPITSDLSGGRNEALFKGEATALRFASSMPKSLGTDPFVLELKLKNRLPADGSPNLVGGQDLVLTWRSLERDEDGQSITDGERVLAKDVAGIAFGYFGAKARDRSPAWHADWQDQDALPALIKLDFQFPQDRRHWPSLSVSPMIDQWYDVSF